MKKLFAVAALLIAGASLAQTDAIFTAKTTAAMSLYVNGSTGSNAYACTTAAAPCKTLAGAIDKVPRRLRHPVTITVAAGNYHGAYISGFTNESGAQPALGSYLNIVGTLATVAAVDGLETGTAESGVLGSGLTYGTITDAQGGWTTNALQGLMIEITGGTGISQIRQIASNTATAITIPGAWAVAPDATSVYAIRDWSTIITTAVDLPATLGTAVGSATGGGIVISNIDGGYNTDIAIDKIKFSLAGKKGIHVLSPRAKILVRHCNLATTTQNGIHVVNEGDIVVEDSTKGTGAANLVSTALSRSGSRLTATRNTTFASIGLLSVGPGGYLAATTNFSYDITGPAFDLYSPAEGFTQNDRVDCVTAGAAKMGIRMGSANLSGRSVGSVGVYGLDVSNCGEGIKVVGSGAVVAAGVISGTANTIGMKVLEGGQIKIASTTTLTGTTEISVDGSATTLAAVRAAVPKVISNNYGSRIWEP